MRRGLLLACVVGLAACSGSGRGAGITSTTSTRSSTSSTEVSGGAAVITTRSLDVGGLVRTYELLVPRVLDLSRPAPLVVVLHGGFGQGSGAVRQGNWDRAAEQHGFVVVAPNGVGRSWNAGICCGPAMRRGVDDVAFIRAALDDAARTHRVDPARIFATGISNGGMMTYRLACEAADRFAAVAPVSSTLSVSACAPAQPISLLHIHGLADRNVPFDGGHPTKSFQRDAPSYPPVRAGIETFARADGCATQPSAQAAAKVTTTTWLACTSGTTVQLITIVDGGHSWPGGNRMAAVLDPPSEALDATTTIWQFFATHPRPAP